MKKQIKIINGWIIDPIKYLPLPLEKLKMRITQRHINKAIKSGYNPIYIACKEAGYFQVSSSLFRLYLHNGIDASDTFDMTNLQFKFLKDFYSDKKVKPVNFIFIKMWQPYKYDPITGNISDVPYIEQKEFIYENQNNLLY